MCDLRIPELLPLILSLRARSGSNGRLDKPFALSCPTIPQPDSSAFWILELLPHFLGIDSILLHMLLLFLTLPLLIIPLDSMAIALLLHALLISPTSVCLIVGLDRCIVV